MSYKLYLIAGIALSFAIYVAITMPETAEDGKHPCPYADVLGLEQKNEQINHERAINTNPSDTNELKEKPAGRQMPANHPPVGDGSGKCPFMPNV